MQAPDTTIMANIATGEPGRGMRQLLEWAWSVRASMTRSRSYPVLGVVVAIGAPLGLLIVRALESRQPPTLAWALADVGTLAVTYAYVTLSTVSVLAALGCLLGHSFDTVRSLSLTDTLTGLFNRRHFAQRLSEELSRGRRHGQAICILCVDIDRLKAINDDLGHEAGDRALVAVCRALKRNVRAIDALARVGGDEFAVLLPHTSARQASRVSRGILREIARRSDGFTGKLSVSIGIAELNAAAMVAPNDVLAAADAALYRAKAAGGGCAAMAGPIPLPTHSRHSALREAALLIDDQERAGDEPADQDELDGRDDRQDEGALVQSLCAACHGDDDVGSHRAHLGVAFCAGCLDRARSPVVYAELGGEC